MAGNISRYKILEWIKNATWTIQNSPAWDGEDSRFYQGQYNAYKILQGKIVKRQFDEEEGITDGD